MNLRRLVTSTLIFLISGLMCLFEVDTVYSNEFMYLGRMNKLRLKRHHHENLKRQNITAYKNRIITQFATKLYKMRPIRSVS